MSDAVEPIGFEAAQKATRGLRKYLGGSGHPPTVAELELACEALEGRPVSPAPWVDPERWALEAHRANRAGCGWWHMHQPGTLGELQAVRLAYEQAPGVGMEGPMLRSIFFANFEKFYEPKDVS